MKRLPLLGFNKMFRKSAITVETQNTTVSTQQAYQEPHTLHRHIISLYDLTPEIGFNTFVAPNATLVGEVQVGSETQIWYGTVIRGDINRVKVGNNCSVGDNTVIHTAAALPTGIPAHVQIGNFVTVQNNCTLYSCSIDDECFIGFKTVILEGAKLEHGCIVGPNSVVPPGRIIPAHQLWAGNPVEYVRDLTKSEMAQVKHMAKQQYALGRDHAYEFLPQNSAYLQKENSENDLNVRPDQYRDKGLTNDFSDRSRAQGSNTIF